jgi:hypothetical protein
VQFGENGVSIGVETGCSDHTGGVRWPAVNRCDNQVTLRTDLIEARAQDGPFSYIGRRVALYTIRGGQVVAIAWASGEWLRHPLTAPKCLGRSPEFEAVTW